jgi:hypothetical protein
MSKIKTIYYPEILDQKIAENAFSYLKNNISWVDGIYSRVEKKVSRSAYSVNYETLNEVDEFIIQLIQTVFNNMSDKNNYGILGIYVNYYKTGQDFCPNHSHKNSIQLVISLGATRRFKVGAKDYSMKSGDAIIFGSSIHGIPIQPEVTDSRISIAIFCKKL